MLLNTELLLVEYMPLLQISFQYACVKNETQTNWKCSDVNRKLQEIVGRMSRPLCKGWNIEYPKKA